MSWNTDGFSRHTHRRRPPQGQGRLPNFVTTLSSRPRRVTVHHQPLQIKRYGFGLLLLAEDDVAVGLDRSRRLQRLRSSHDAINEDHRVPAIDAELNLVPILVKDLPDVGVVPELHHLTAIPLLAS